MRFAKFLRSLRIARFLKEDQKIARKLLNYPRDALFLRFQKFAEFLGEETRTVKRAKSRIAKRKKLIVSFLEAALQGIAIPQMVLLHAHLTPSAKAPEGDPCRVAEAANQEAAPMAVLARVATVLAHARV